MVEVLSFNDAMEKVSASKHKHLLLGNGFSIALKPDIFSYSSLYDNADFSKNPKIPMLFNGIQTNDFEKVIKYLQDTETVFRIYWPELLDHISDLHADASAVKDALVSAIAKKHPDRPYDITQKQYASCRRFLSKFENIYTLNYDVILYWTLMQEEVDQIDLRADDGFRHPDGNTQQPYVSWQQPNTSKIHYLHGALHLFDNGSEIIKFTWSKTEKAIVDQIRGALNEERYPLFVAEGSSSSKMERILHNAYLHKCLRSLEGCCRPAGNSIVIFGHSLEDNDAHVLKCISHGSAKNLLVSLYGDPGTPQNKKAIKNSENLSAMRHDIHKGKNPLHVTFYNAESANIWTN